MSEFMFTVGKDKQKVPASQMKDSNLEWYRDKCNAEVPRRAAIEELNRRANGGAVQSAQRQAQATRAIQTAPAAENGNSLLRGGAHHVAVLAKQDPEAITKALNELVARYHLVTPTTSVDALPPGFGVSITYLPVDPNDKSDGPGEVYSVGGGKLALSGTTLSKIGAAAGIDWNPRESGRLDDGSDPNYVHFRAVGYVRNFDGTARTVCGEVEIDLRKDSPQVDEIVSKAREKYPNDAKPGAKQLREARKFILRHAERKAKNRAVADMGVKRSFTAAELAKPFAIAKLMWTGQTDDPELRREFARMGAERMLTSISAAYGRGPALPARAVRQVEPFEGHAPTPIGEVDESLDSDGDALDAVGEEYEADAEPGETEAESGAMPAAQATPVPAAAAQGSTG